MTLFSNNPLGEHFWGNCQIKSCTDFSLIPPEVMDKTSVSHKFMELLSDMLRVMLIMIIKETTRQVLLQRKARWIKLSFLHFETERSVSEYIRFCLITFIIIIIVIIITIIHNKKGVHIRKTILIWRRDVSKKKITLYKHCSHFFSFHGKFKHSLDFGDNGLVWIITGCR